MRGTIFVVGALAVAATAAPATSGAAEPDVYTESADHASVALHAPWGYADGEGLDHHPDLSPGTTPVEPAVPGTVEWRADGDWNVQLQAMTWPHPGPDPGALHEQSEGLGTPIDADRFTRLSMNIWSSRTTTLNVGFFVCQEFTNPCYGEMPVRLYAGWNMVSAPLVGDEDTAWTGDVYGLRLRGAGAADDTFRLDWVRVHEPGQQLTYDTATSLMRWSTEGPTAPPRAESDGMTGGNLPPGDTIDVGALPPGHYFVYEDNQPLDEFVIEPLPRPEILDPDVSGGEDYATTVLGDPWDFDGPGDVLAVRNATDLTWADGRLSATNDLGSPAPNDPNIVLRLGPGGIDPVHYHRLTVRTWYDGTFGLDDRTGGGTHGRLLWRTPSHAPSGVTAYSDGRELVFYTDQDEYRYDLADVRHDPVYRSTAEPNVDPDGTPFAPPDPTWTSAGPVTYLRFDPNEAPSAYRWHVDDIRLAADDAAAPTFDITWRDPTWQPGTEATIRLDDDRTGYDGEVLATVTETGERNTLTFDATWRLPATYWVNVTVRTPDGRVGRSYATGPLQVAPRIAGSGRIATAVALSRQTFPEADGAVLASAADFPDALSAGALADAAGAPLLLTAPDRIDGAVLDELDRLGVTRVDVVGGSAAVEPAVVAALEDRGYRVQRLGGESRFHTAATVAAEAVRRWGGADRVVVATGEDFPDALAAAPLLGQTDTPLLLTGRDVAPDATREAIAALDPGELVVLGGRAAVGDDVARTLAAGRPWRRIAGDDRFATARALAEAAADAGASRDNVLVAVGTDFPDALAAGVAANGRGGLLVLTAPTSIPSDTAELLRGHDGAWDSWRAVGGSAAISHANVRRLRALSGL